jgi:hypothetical protein
VGDAGEQTNGADHGRGRGCVRSPLRVRGEAGGEGDGGVGRGRGRGAGAPNSHASSAIGKKKYITRGIIENLRFRHLGAVYL